MTDSSTYPGISNSSLLSALQEFIRQEKLPDDYLDTVVQWFLPLAEDLLKLTANSRQAPVIGVSGCQGSGKSTLAALLVLLVKELMGVRAVNLSIDDFYLSYDDRQQLAARVHPLFATRGVPGTHDVALAMETIRALRQPGEVAIPRFDKAMDDRLPVEQWPTVTAPVDLIVLEGWCLSVPHQDESELQIPINALEAQEDENVQWRDYVNSVLQQEYKDWYGMVDYLIMLKAPDFARVKEWRGRQEQKLAASQSDGAANRVMSNAELERFIQHYERLTRHGLEVLPALADVVFDLTDKQTIAGSSKT